MKGVHVVIILLEFHLWIIDPMHRSQFITICISYPKSIQGHMQKWSWVHKSQWSNEIDVSRRYSERYNRVYWENDVSKKQMVENIANKATSHCCKAKQSSFGSSHYTIHSSYHNLVFWNGFHSVNSVASYIHLVIKICLCTIFNKID